MTICSQNKCIKQARFAYRKDDLKKFCKTHSEKCMINVYTKTCLECPTIPNYNVPTEKTGIYCKIHKKEGMVDVNNRKCLKCSTRPTFNFPNEKCGIYCAEHREEGMVDVNHTKCLKCGARPQYNFPNKKIGIYCAKHREEGMVDVKSKRCLKCDICPAFNFPNKKAGIYCIKHREEGMVDVMSKRCLKCYTRPCYNFPNKKIGIYCIKHREKGMVNVKDKRCIKCNISPVFNFPDKKVGIYCIKHREEGMVDVISKRCLKCDKRPSYNYKGEKSAYCADHREENMVNVKHKKCASGHCDTIANKYYNNYCCYCFTNLFPTDPKTLSARKNNKEIAVKSWLYENGHSDFVHNRPIYLGKDCSTMRRVDLYKYIGDKHILCIEIDENQHKYYNREDEENRYHELYKDGYIQVYIRYNPDKYRDISGKNKNPFFKTRMKRLEDEIKVQINSILSGEKEEDLLYISKLYYDYNDLQNQSP